MPSVLTRQASGIDLSSGSIHNWVGDNLTLQLLMGTGMTDRAVILKGTWGGGVICLQILFYTPVIGR